MHHAWSNALWMMTEQSEVMFPKLICEAMAYLTCRLLALRMSRKATQQLCLAYAASHQFTVSLGTHIGPQHIGLLHAHLCEGHDSLLQLLLFHAAQKRLCLHLQEQMQTILSACRPHCFLDKSRS